METSNAYQSIYDGPAIDAAIARASEGGHIDAAIQAKPNPNLLDNWYFGNPVNQRGQTEYTAAGYTIDRWKSGNSELKAELTSAGLAVSSAGASNAYLSQYFDGGIPIGDSYTISALVEAVTGTAYFQAAYSDGTFGSSIKLEQGLNTLAIKTDKTITRVLIQANNSSSVTIKAAKLELGSQQTLAHQDENGNWVLNEVPDYGEQLAKCQRYQVRVGYAEGSTYAPVLANGVAVSTTSIRALIPTPVTLRVNPSIGYFESDTLSTVHALGGGASLTPTYALAIANSNGVLLVLTVSGATMNETYAITLDQARGILLDANL